jgi:hypothetical protein
MAMQSYVYHNYMLVVGNLGWRETIAPDPIAVPDKHAEEEKD